MTKWLKPISIILTLLILALAGWRVAQFKLDVVKKIQFVGHSDESAYASMARSIVAGKGLEVPYISYYFTPYDPNILRREDHWPPLMGYCIAPFFYFWGQDAWVAKIAPILFGSFLLPLFTAALAMVYSRRAYVGLIAGALVLVEPIVFSESMKTQCDVPTAGLFAAFCWALLSTRNLKWMHLVVGLFIGLAYLCKGSQIILLGLYPLSFFILVGWQKFWQSKKWLALGYLTAAVLIVPFMFNNWRAYGNPVHSTQNYISGNIGLLGGGDLGWEKTAYWIYWDKPLPKPSDRWTKNVAEYQRLIPRNIECFTRWAILGPGTGFDPIAWDDLGSLGRAIPHYLLPEMVAPNKNLPVKPVSEWMEALQAVTGLAAIAGLPLVFLTAPVIMFLRRRRQPKPLATDPNSPTIEPKSLPPQDEPAPGLVRPTIVLILLLLSQWVFLVVFWQWLWMNRLSLIFVPIMLTLGLTYLSRFIESPVLFLWLLVRPRDSKRAQRWEGVTPFILNLFILTALGIYGLTSWIVTQPTLPRLERFGGGWLGQKIAQLATSDLQYSYPWKDNESTPGYGPTMRMAAFIKNRLPNAVIMSRYPWQLTYYAAPTNRGVALPLDDDALRIFAIAKYYHCTHIVHDDNNYPRQALEPYFSSPLSWNHIPGLKRVPNAPGGSLYEIEWSQLPELPTLGVSTIGPVAPAGDKLETAPAVPTTLSNTN